MKLVTNIVPVRSLGSLYPPGTVYAPRSTISQMRLVTNEPYQLDRLTGHTLGIMGEMPLICHRNTATAEILDFVRLAGLAVPGTLHLYETEAEARELARRQVERGRRLASPYLPFPELADDRGLVTPVHLYRWLNDKANLGKLVPSANLPPNVVLPVEQVESVVDIFPGQSIFVKGCHAGASGGGVDLRYCEDEESRRDAVAWLVERASEWSAVRVEEAVEVGTSWCVSLAISDDGVVVLGAASQRFSRPGEQYGSRIDPDDAPTPEVFALVREVAKRGRDLGYRGVAGFDTALTRDGRVIVFDLNFRPAASTPQVLMHEPAVATRDGRVTQSWNATLPSCLAPILDRLKPYVLDGSFIPLRLYEGTPASLGTSTVTGMIVAPSAEEVDALDSRIHAALRDLLPDAPAA